jgi:hypothetical protein
MGKLVLLIAMVLAGAAGYYLGSWSGRDALQALSKAKDLGIQAQVEHDKAVKSLQDKVASMGTAYAQEKQKLEVGHQQAKNEFTATLVKRDERIAALGKRNNGTVTQLTAARAAAASANANTGTAPAEKARLQAVIDRLEGELAAQKTLIAGLECSKVQVPEELLAPLRVGSAR